MHVSQTFTHDDFVWLPRTVAEHEMAHVIVAHHLNVKVVAVECHTDSHGWGYGRCNLDTVSLLLASHETQQMIAVAGCVRIGMLQSGYRVERFLTDENYTGDNGDMGDREMYFRARGAKESLYHVAHRVRNVLSTPWATQLFAEWVPVLLRSGRLHLHGTAINSLFGG